jgi:hypothetical protein
VKLDCAIESADPDQRVAANREVASVQDGADSKEVIQSQS